MATVLTLQPRTVYDAYGLPHYPLGSPPLEPRPSVLDRAALHVPEFKGTLPVARPGDPEPYVFGRKLITPTVIAAGTDSSGRLCLDLLLSVGPIDSIEYLTFAGVNEGRPVGFEFYEGTLGQSASPIMTAIKGTYDTLTSKAHVVVRLNPGTSLDIKAMVRGLHVYDPRNVGSPTSEYTQNPALILGRILTDCGYTVDATTLGTAADYCDELVSSAKRWECAIHINHRESLATWAGTLAQYANVYIDIQGGTAYLIKDCARASTHTVTAADVVEGSFRVTKRGGKNTPARVAVHYTEADGTQKTAETATSADPGQTARLQMPGFTSYTMARRYAVGVYNKAQSDLGVEFTSFDDGLALSIGDVGTITHAQFGLASKQMTLIEYSEVERGRWRRRYTEYDAAHYSSALFVEPTTGDTDLPNPNTPPTGPTPSLSEELYTDRQTGTTYTRLKVTFTGLTWPYIQGYRVTVAGTQNVLETIIANQGAVTHTVYTHALTEGVSHAASVYVISVTGVASTVAGTASIVSAGKLLPPGDVPSLSAYEAGTLVSMTWSPAEEIDGDLRGYVIKRLPLADYTGTSADWTHTNAVTLAERIDATTYLTAAQPEGYYYYGVKAVDHAGNYSDNAIWSLVNVTAVTGSSNTSFLGAGTSTNVHVYTIGGDAQYAITSSGQTWGQRFGNTSPLARWGAQGSPTERWGGDLRVECTFNTEAWDTGATRQGNWFWSDQYVDLFNGATQANRILIGDNSSPINWVTHTGNTVQSAGRYMIARVFYSDSPVSAGDGLHIRLPVEVSFSGAILEQSGSSTIAATSPLVNPKTVTFTTPYTTAPDLTITLTGTSPKIVAYDGLDANGFDWYCWTTAGAKTDGTITWTAKGT